MTIRVPRDSVALARQVTDAAMGIERVVSDSAGGAYEISQAGIAELHHVLDVLQHEIKQLRASLPRRNG